MKIYHSEMMMQAMNQLKLQFVESGWVHADPTWHAENVCSPYSRLYFIADGMGCLETEEQCIQMQPGNVYLIPAGVTFSYHCPSEMDKLYFHVTVLMPNGFDLLRGARKILSGPYLCERILQMRERYFRKGNLDAFVQEAEVRYAMAELLAQMCTDFPPITEYSEPVDQAIRYIRQHLSLQLTAAHIAEKLFLSESQLSRRFREETGCTVSQYIDDLLFFSAQMQLAGNDRSIGEISESLGFCDQFYFSRRFRQRYHITPRQYRERLLAERRTR